MNHISFLLVDDEELFRAGLRSLLEREDFVGEIHEAGNATEFGRLIVEKKIDIILLDIKLPGIKGLDLVSNLLKEDEHPRVIAVTGLEGVEVVINLLKAGVSGIVFKLDGYPEIIKTINEVMRNGSFFQEKTLRTIQLNANRWDKVPTISLTFHENELLRAIASGLTTKQIAAQLRLTEATTETYRIRLMKKLSVPNTASLLAYAFRNGIL